MYIFCTLCTVFMFCFLFYNHPYTRLLIYNPNLNFKMNSHNTLLSSLLPISKITKWKFFKELPLQDK